MAIRRSLRYRKPKPKPRLVVIDSESDKVIDSCPLSKKEYHFIVSKGEEFGSVQCYFEKLITDAVEAAKANQN